MIIGVIALFVTIFFCKVSYEKKILEEQKKELSIIYPELADELSENISYYTDKNIQTDFLIMLVAMLLTVIALAGTYFLLISANNKS